VSELEELRRAEMGAALAIPRERESFVYFLECKGANAIKIGRSVDPRARLEALQAGCPLPLHFIVKVRGGTEEEGMLHRRFGHLRIHGEWFRAEGDLVDYVLGLEEGEPIDYDALYLEFKRCREARIAAESRVRFRNFQERV
jgi:hypothetical protein